MSKCPSPHLRVHLGLPSPSQIVRLTLLDLVRAQRRHRPSLPSPLRSKRQKNQLTESLSSRCLQKISTNSMSKCPSPHPRVHLGLQSPSQIVPLTLLDLVRAQRRHLPSLPSPRRLKRRPLKKVLWLLISTRRKSNIKLKKVFGLLIGTQRKSNIKTRSVNILSKCRLLLPNRVLGIYSFRMQTHEF